MHGDTKQFGANMPCPVSQAVTLKQSSAVLMAPDCQPLLHGFARRKTHAGAGYCSSTDESCQAAIQVRDSIKTPLHAASYVIDQDFVILVRLIALYELMVSVRELLCGQMLPNDNLPAT